MPLTSKKTETDTIFAREYLRVSNDKSGRERSPNEQHADHERTAGQHGWQLGNPYRDIGSASRHATKARADFDRLIADLAADRFGASVLMLWEPSRGSRRESEWINLIELCEEHSVLIWVETHRRTYDCTVARDRKSLMEDALDSAYESAKVSDRVKRTCAANATMGRPHGRVPFGYMREYDSTSGRLVGQVKNPVTSLLIKELFRRLKRGHSLRAIAADWQKREIVNGSGKPFSPQHLRSLALNIAYAGYRSHDPKRDQNRRLTLTGDATVVRATWPAIVSMKDFLHVQALLSSPERVTTKPGKARHFLSMIGRCGECSGPISVTARGTEPQYQCHHKGCIRIRQADVDQYAEDLILAFLASEDAYDALNTEPDDKELEAVQERLAAQRQQLAELGDAVAALTISVALAARSEPKILAEIAKLEKLERDLATPSSLFGLIEPGPDVRKRWKNAEMSTKRAIARLLLTPDLLGELRVFRSPTPGHTAPVERRVRFTQAG